MGCKKKETARFSLLCICHNVQKNHESVLVRLMRIAGKKLCCLQSWDTKIEIS